MGTSGLCPADPAVQRAGSTGPVETDGPERGPAGCPPATRLPPELGTRSSEGAASPGWGSHPIWRGTVAWGSGTHPLTLSQPWPRRGQTQALRGPPLWAVADAKGTWGRGHPGRGAQRKLWKPGEGVRLPGRLRRVLFKGPCSKNPCNDSGTFQNAEGLGRPGCGAVRAVQPGQQWPPQGMDHAAPWHTVPPVEGHGPMACGQRAWPGKGQGSAGHPVSQPIGEAQGCSWGMQGRWGGARDAACGWRQAQGGPACSGLASGRTPRCLGWFEAAGLVLEQSEGTACPGPTDLMALLWAASGGWETDLGHL